jgi:hypothetical protein
MMKRAPKTPALAKLAMLLLFAIAAVAILDTNTISAQELGRTITSPFGIARQTSASESGSEGDTFVDPETGEVGHIIRNPFGVANPNDVDTGIDIPDSGEEEVGGIITSPFGVPASDDIDTGVDVFDEDEEYLISLPDDEESDAENSEDVDEVDDETSDDEKEIGEESYEATTEKYVPVVDNPTRGGEYSLCEIIKLEAQYDSQDIITSWSSYSNYAPTIYVQAGSTFTIRAFSSTGNWPSGNPTWTFENLVYSPTSPYDIAIENVNLTDNSFVNVTLYPTIASGKYAICATCHADNGFTSRKCINVVVCSLQFTIDNPILPSNGQVDYHSILVTNVADELPFTGKPDYADFEERVCESSIKTLHFQINAQNARFQDCKLRVAYEGVDDINAIEVPELISDADLALLKDIYMRGNNRYYDYTALKRGVLRVWTSSKPVLQDGEWISNSEMSTTSARDKKKYGIGDGNYLAPTNQPGEAYTFADLFPNQNSNSMPHDITFYVEGINLPHGNEYGNIIVTLLCYNPAINKWVDVASETVSFKIIEANVILNANNDPNYNLIDFDHIIKDQHDGFQGWFADQFDDSTEENTHGYENLFPILVKNLTPLPQGMKYVLKINNDGVLLKHPIDIQNNQSNILDYIKKRRAVEDLDCLFSEQNLPTSLVVDTTNQDLTNGLFYLFAIYRRYGVITDYGRISIYLSPNENNVQTNLIELDNARYTFRTIDKYFELWSSRGEANYLYQYPLDAYATDTSENPADITKINESTSLDSNTILFYTYPDASRISSFSVNRDTSKDSLVVLHGYNVSEEEAYDFHRLVFRRLYWAGYRNNYIGWTWRGDEFVLFSPDDDETLNNNPNNSDNELKEKRTVVSYETSNCTPGNHVNSNRDIFASLCFRTNILNAFRTSRALNTFLNTLPTNKDIFIAAHSLGNLVIWDAIRLQTYNNEVRNHREPRRENVSFKSVISFEGAVWEEAFRPFGPIEYVAPLDAGHEIRYSPSDLIRHSWAFWFRQKDHDTLNLVENFFNCRTQYDSILLDMKYYNLLYSTHYNRVLEQNSRNPNYNSLPQYAALMKIGYRRPSTDHSIPYDKRLMDPMGLAVIECSNNIDSTCYGWNNYQHSSFRIKPYYEIGPWYKVFVINLYPNLEN